MPILRSGQTPPAWCEMTHFDIVRLAPGDRHTYPRMGQKERLFVCEGQCRIDNGQVTVNGERGIKLDLLDANGQFAITEVLANTILVRVCGHWGEELGGSGLFQVVNSDNPQDKGDPVPYAKQTNFDSHYHDYDEYWILYKGRAVVVSEGKHYPVSADDCVATGMGHHHDFPQVEERVEAVFFETTVGGQGRRGHLWNHTHGPAQPQPERV